jgi:hypothetical protein
MLAFARLEQGHEFVSDALRTSDKGMLADLLTDA